MAVQYPVAAVPFSYDEKHDNRWKWYGYRAAAQHMASDNDLFLVRRFATANTRVLLAKQAEIHSLEQMLNELDKPRVGEPAIDNSTVLDDQRLGRPQLINTLWKLLKEYNDFIISHSALRARPSASRLELQNLEKWRTAFNGAICPEEEKLFNHVEDLVPIVSKPKTQLRSVLERCGNLLTSPPFRKELQSKFSDEEDPATKYFDDELVDRFVYIVIVIVGLGMLLGPLWWLYEEETPKYRLAIITGFIILFTLLLGTTQAGPHETMAATAGYSAVLMIYMQISTPLQ